MDIKNSIKKLAINVLPYSFVKKILAKTHSRHSIIRYNPNLPGIESCTLKFKSIISVQGLGFSGSGAVVDYLREYSNCLVSGSIDKEGSITKRGNQVNAEFDLLRYAGGLFEFEHYLDDNNPFTKDALIKRFVRLVNSSALFRNRTISCYINQFYNELVDFEIETKGRNDYNEHVSNDLFPDSNIKFLKHFEVEDYRLLCKKLIVSICNTFYNKAYDFFVLDQLCSDFNYDCIRYFEYIPNLKIVLVIRDPRDTYAFSILKDVPWIPHDNVDTFIKWYGIMVDKIDLSSKDYLVVRFEELVFFYEQTKKKIDNYLQLKKENHLYKNTCFDPRVSKDNIAIWKKDANHLDDMKKILKAYPEFCFSID